MVDEGNDGARAYEGLTVLDLSHVYLGPYCTMLMARLGAEVIKIEPPGGEPLRFYHSSSGRDTAAFGLLNAGKRSMQLDLKQPTGRALFLRLVEQADVVVENFGPNTLTRLDLEYEVLEARNPSIILASGRGYGSTGPYRQYLAMDLMIQAMTGVMAATGFPDDPPVKSGAAVADFSAGIHLFGAIGAALYQRSITGKGQHVIASMHSSLLPATASPLAAWIDSDGAQPERTGNRHSGLAVAPYNVYPTKDGWIAILALTDRHWRTLCEVMGRPDLGDGPDHATNAARVRRMKEVDAAISEWTDSRSKHEIFARLSEAEVPAAPVLSLSEVVSDSHVRTEAMLQEVVRDGRPVLTFGNPLELSDSPSVAPTEVPALGKDSEQILVERLGLSGSEVEGLGEEGVV